MRLIRQYIIPIILLTLTGLVSCGKHDSGKVSESLSAVLTTGTWHVSYYYEDYTDKTSQLDGFIFTFSDNGVLTAKKPGYTSTGTWSYSYDEEKLWITIGADQPLKDLTDDYVFISYSTTVVQLRESITSKDCYLTFTQN
jgi:hypothetical protein